MIVRFLGGIIPNLCESCRRGIAIISIVFNDDVFVVCYDCRP
jgi:hypothetical protein